MCGIGVIVSPVGITSGQLRVMSNLMNHRGPDYTGIRQDSHVGMCHTRLSILDPQPRSNQPYELPDGEGLLAYNGEIYNYRELRSRLEALGRQFHSTGDTEVVAQAIAEWGANAFLEFDGMFGLAFYQPGRKKVLLARDRMGIKPIHYFRKDDLFAAASEMRPLISLLDSVPIRSDAISDGLLFGHIEGERTYFSDIYSLRPGHWAEISLSDPRPQIQRYWDPFEEASKAQSSKKPNWEDHVSGLDSVLRRSVESHMISDAPLGSLCSGGVDSTLITALARKINPNITIFHAGVADGPGEEIYARKAGRHLGVQIQTADIDRKTYIETLPQAIRHLEYPTYHPNDISLYNVCRLARDNGIKVLLCGEGADELFGGYQWHVNFCRLLRARACLKHLRPAGRVLAGISSRFQNLLFSLKEPEDHFIRWAGMLYPYGSSAGKSLMKASCFLYNNGQNADRWIQALSSSSSGAKPTGSALEALLLDNMIGHLGSILHRTDRMGMMASIENRVPFLENEVIKYAFSIPIDYKVTPRQGKVILKKMAENYLPRSVVYRKKAGFPVPWSDYIKNIHTVFARGFVEDSLGYSTTARKAIAAGDPQLAFRLLGLEIWGRLFVRKEDIDDVKELLCRDLPGSRT